MNSARLFFPATASIRSAMPVGRRTTIGSTFKGGRPILAAVPDIGNSINRPLKAISLIDCITDIGYQGNISNGGRLWPRPNIH